VTRCHKGKSSFINQTSLISNLSSGLRTRRSTFRGETLKKAAFACHLRRVADFLLPGEGVWFESGPDEMIFFGVPDDVGDRRAGPALMNHK